MKIRMTGVCLTLVASFTMSAFVMAQDATQERVTPRFVVLPPKPLAPNAKLPATSLQTWNGMFTYNNHQYNYVMVGADPATNQAAQVTTYVIPVRMIVSGQTFDPLSGGSQSPLARTVLSPLFDHSTTYVQGGVNVGKTQYLDAYQRANFWSIVQNNPQSHLFLGGPSSKVTVLPTLSLTVPSGSGHLGSPFGYQVGEVDINYFDAQISNYMANTPSITPDKLPIFLVNNVYLTEGGCCIGGYHSANGPQTYMVADYDSHPGVFSQDVSALSHEIGEWVDDPLTNGQNNSPCGILENGDPLEGTGNYGSYPYVLHGFTYNLQDLVFLRYFGAPATTSVNNWWSFQNYPFTSICQNGS